MLFVAVIVVDILDGVAIVVIAAVVVVVVVAIVVVVIVSDTRNLKGSDVGEIEALREADCS